MMTLGRKAIMTHGRSSILVRRLMQLPPAINKLARQQKNTMMKGICALLKADTTTVTTEMKGTAAALAALRIPVAAVDTGRLRDLRPLLATDLEDLLTRLSIKAIRTISPSRLGSSE